MAKVNLYPDFKELLELLNSAGVKYLVLGGYAVIYYGYRRATDDLDIWIATDAENSKKVVEVLKRFGGFTATQVKPSMFQELGKLFIVGREPVRVDLLTGPSGIVFNECYRRRNTVQWDGVRVPVIAFEDLRINKKSSGRAKDLADLENLPPSVSPAKKRGKRRRPHRQK
jgi:predicted nucleotidyltransferase